jgi:predicted outer membrane repeat protein
MFRAWIRSLFVSLANSRPLRGGRRAKSRFHSHLRNRYRLEFDALEDRAVPAVLWVDSSNIGGAGAGAGQFTAADGTTQTGLTLGTNLFTTVGAAVAASNNGDTINIADGIFTEAGNATVSTSNSLNIFSFGTAANPTEFSNTVRRFFAFNSTNAPHAVTVTFQEAGNPTDAPMIFDGGTTGGGVVLNGGGTNKPNVTFTNVTFQNNAASLDGGATKDGGAIDVKSGNLTLTNDSFTNNSATRNGGAVALFATLGASINGTTFLKNTANAGGALYLDSTVLASTVSLNGDAFGDGTAGNANSATTTGGAIEHDGGTLSFVTATTTINKNSAADGGAIHMAGTSLTINSFASLTNNSATDSGGAIQASNALTLTIDGATLSGNSATNDGGALDIEGTSTATIRNNSQIIGNSAASGGGIFMNGTTLNVLSGSFIGKTGVGNGNIATGANGGGGLFVNAGIATLTNASVLNNSATTGPGGGVVLAGGTLTIDPTVISGNTAAGDGGGMDVTGGTLTLSAGDSVTSNSSTGGDGGGINFAGGTGHSIDGTTFTLNHANTGVGGAINLASGFADTVTVTNSLIGDSVAADANTASGGGGIAVAAGTLDLSTSSVTNNTAEATAASNGGGLLVSSGATLVSVTNVTIAKNAANNNGGGVEAEVGPNITTFNYVTIAQNQADADNAGGGSGGGIFATVASAASITNTILAQNLGTAGAIDNSNKSGPGSITNGHHNMVGGARTGLGALNGTDKDVSAGSDTAALIAPLSTYGAANNTLTFALLPGSPAINAASGANATDQRGVARPAQKDIGAFESQGFTIAKVSPLVQQTAIVNTAFASQLVVSITANDVNEPVNGGTITFTPPSNAANPTASIGGNPAGTAVDETISLGQASTTLLTANDQGGPAYNVTAATTASNSVSFSLKNSDVAGLSFTVGGGVEPGNTVSGQKMTEFDVQLLDDMNMALAKNNVSVTISIAPPGGTNSGNTNFGAGTLVTSLTVKTDSNGIAHFSASAAKAITIDRSDRYTLLATAGLVTATSTPFNITASTLAFSDNSNASDVPSVSRSGQVVPIFHVYAVGVDGFDDPNYTQLVTISAPTNPGGGASTPTAISLSSTAVAGVATFDAPSTNDIRLHDGGNYKFRATDGTLTSAQSSTILVTAKTVAFTTTPGSVTLGPGEVRSANAASANVANLDFVNTSLQGLDDQGHAAAIDATLTVALNSATQNSLNDILASAVFGGTKTTLSSGNTASYINANGLIIDKWGTYTLKISAASNTTSETGYADLVTPSAASNAFKVSARSVVLDPSTPTAVRSGASFATKLDAVDVTFNGSNLASALDKNFIGSAALAIANPTNTTSGSGSATLSGNGGSPYAINMGQSALISGLSIDRGGSYNLTATATNRVAAPYAIAVNASNLRFLVDAGHTIGSTAKSGQLRSANAGAGNDPTQDDFNVTIVGVDITGAIANIASTVTVGINTAMQGATNIKNDAATLFNGVHNGTATSSVVAGTQFTFTSALGITINRWGDYTFTATGTGGLIAAPLAGVGSSGTVHVYGRTTEVISAPAILHGSQQIQMGVFDANGQLDKSFNAAAGSPLVTLFIGNLSASKAGNVPATVAAGAGTTLVAPGKVGAKPVNGIVTLNIVTSSTVIGLFVPQAYNGTGVPADMRALIAGAPTLGLNNIIGPDGRRRSR